MRTSRPAATARPRFGGRPAAAAHPPPIRRRAAVFCGRAAATAAAHPPPRGRASQSIVERGPLPYAPPSDTNEPPTRVRSSSPSRAPRDTKQAANAARADLSLLDSEVERISRYLKRETISRNFSTSREPNHRRHTHTHHQTPHLDEPQKAQQPHHGEPMYVWQHIYTAWRARGAVGRASSLSAMMLPSHRRRGGRNAASRRKKNVIDKRTALVVPHPFSDDEDEEKLRQTVS